MTNTARVTLVLPGELWEEVNRLSLLPCLVTDLSQPPPYFYQGKSS
jgi:hypothetical protein